MLPQPIYRFYQSSSTAEQVEEQHQSLRDAEYDFIDLSVGGEFLHAEYIAETETNTILSSGDFSELVDITADQKEAGYELIDVRYSDALGTWTGVYDNNAVPTTHFHTDDLAEFTTHANEQITSGIDLIDVEYGDGTISAIFADTPRAGTYIANENYDDFVNAVNENIVFSSFGSKGRFDLTDIEYIDGTYVGVLGDFIGSSSYAFRYTDYDEFQAEIQRQISERQSALVDVEYIDGAWFGVLNENITDVIDPLSQDFPTPSDADILLAQLRGEAASFDTFVLPNL